MDNSLKNNSGLTLIEILIGIVIGFTIKRYDPSNKKNQIIGKAA